MPERTPDSAAGTVPVTANPSSVDATRITVLTIDVVGTPAPQGGKLQGSAPRSSSARRIQRAVGPWREAVAWQVLAAMLSAGTTRITGPVAVEVEFLLPRPALAPARSSR